jgi:hypothetical protein
MKQQPNDPYIESRKAYMPIRLKALECFLDALQDNHNLVFPSGECPRDLVACWACPGCTDNEKHSDVHMFQIQDQSTAYDTKVQSAKLIIDNIKDWLDIPTINLNWPEEDRNR